VLRLLAALQVELFTFKHLHKIRIKYNLHVFDILWPWPLGWKLARRFLAHALENIHTIFFVFLCLVLFPS